MVHRASYNHLYAASQRSPLHLRSIIGRSRSHRVLQVRQLWWWGRHGNHSQWSSSFDEHMEERLRRQQRIIRHQYSKMLRRRELWDRDRGFRLSWPWKLSHHWLGTHLTEAQTLSSTNTPKSKVEEQRDEDGRREGPLATFHKDFESFKKAVDQAIERDPYGTLFGRRLQSPPTNNNSSWTSFSWIFDPKEIKEEKVEPANEASNSSPKTGSSPPRVPANNEPPPANASPVPTHQSMATDEYEYDPISMRRVLKARAEPLQPEPPPHSQSSPQPQQSAQPQKPSHPLESANLSKPESPTDSPPPKNAPKSNAEPAQRSNESLFQALFFTEHGVDIPVKTYKPHKVYGPRAVSQQEKTESEASKKKVAFETNRKHELNALKAAALGNTIDTTAEFGGKYTGYEEAAPKDPPRTPQDRSIPSDDAPLFSGTTYEGRSSEILKPVQPISNWLRKEGFTLEQTLSGKNTGAVDIPVKKFVPTIESGKKGNVRSGKLEPALDRQTQSTGGEPSFMKGSTMRDQVAEKPEDLDFLRASDIRAATRSGRTSRLEVEEEKMQTRKRLEDDFSARQKQSETDAAFARPDPRSMMSKSLDNVWKHVQNYPDGIVARTVKSMGMFNDSIKKYVRPESKVDLTQKLDFKNESLNNVSSIYKPRRKTSHSISFSPSKEVLEADRVDLKRTRELREASWTTERSSHAETIKANDLAKDLKREYEDMYGPISVHHRQPTSRESGRSDVASEQANREETHPLSTATVKGGVPRYPEIESYVSKFEPEFAKLVGEAKAVRRELHEAQLHYRTLKERMNILPWSEIETTKPPEVKSASAVEIHQSTSAQGLDEPIAAPQTREIKQEAGEKATPINVQKPVFTPDESVVWNDEHPPSISELRKASAAPFVILKYNSESDTVARSNTHFHEAGRGQPSPPLKILSRLRRSEKFFPFFEQLEKEKYEIISSDSDTLMFRKIRDPAVLEREQEEARITQAAQEASAQPVIQEMPETQPTSLTNTPPPKEAATVLDEIPIEIEPAPGPSAPTAPPPTPTSKPVQSRPASKPKVKRQENVFSGTRRTLPPTTNPIDPEIATPRPASSSYQEQYDEPTAPSGFSRFLRTTKRVFLTVLGLSVGAYVVGVITEGINAKAQQKAIVDGGAGLGGPRKKIVLTKTRPGIFSTENSR